MTLRSRVIRLAHANPEIRGHILPLLKEASDNPYGLYSSTPGWEKAEKEIDAAVEEAKNYLRGVYGNGDPLAYAMKTIIGPVLRKNSEFGTADSEPRDSVRWILTQFLKSELKIRVSDWD